MGCDARKNLFHTNLDLLPTTTNFWLFRLFGLFISQILVDLLKYESFFRTLWAIHAWSTKQPKNSQVMLMGPFRLSVFLLQWQFLHSSLSRTARREFSNHKKYQYQFVTFPSLFHNNVMNPWELNWKKLLG